MNKSEDIKELACALSKVQASLEGAKKDSVNPYFKSKYADLEAVWEACRKPLTDNDLAVIQTMGYIPNTHEAYAISDKDGTSHLDAVPVTATLITTLVHSSGQYISGEQPLLLRSPNPQDQGSAITYARRYGLAAILGIHQTDDDAQSAMPKNGQAAYAK